jgi:hypothetical protein
MLKSEARAIVERVLEVGEGDLAVGQVRAVKEGSIDLPFQPWIHLAGKVLTVRDRTGAIRHLEHGNVPLPKEVIEYHREMINAREKEEGRKADLNIISAEWTGLSSRTDPPIARTQAVLASIDPVALDYLAQTSEENGIDVEVLDLAFSTNAQLDIQSTLRRMDPLLIGVTIRNLDDSYLASQDFCLERAKTIVEHIQARTEAPLVLGGVGFSAMPESVLDYCRVGMGIRGEGEWSLPRLAKKLAKREDPGKIHRLVEIAPRCGPISEERHRDDLITFDFRAQAVPTA